MLLNIFTGTALKTSGGRNSDLKQHTGFTAPRTGIESLVVQKVVGSAGRDGDVSVEQCGTIKDSHSSNLLISVFEKNDGEDAGPMCLKTRTREHAMVTSMMKETEIICSRGTQTIWSNRISGKATALAGSQNFWAVGYEDGSLQVYTKSGRQLIPTMMMGSEVKFLDCDGGWKLLLVTKTGSLYVWDMFTKKRLVRDSLSSLRGTREVKSAKLSKCGSPVVVLATRHAFLFDMSLMGWLRVADDCFPKSAFSSLSDLGPSAKGELANLQLDVRKYMAGNPGCSSRVTDDGVQTRSYLESQLASALAMESASEYRQSLLFYIHFLTREADESLLREVCEDLLGPPTGMAEATSTDAKNMSWDPYVLGMKKHKLLREDVLPAMTTNTKVEQLVKVFMDRLSKYGDTETAMELWPVKPKNRRTKRKSF